MSRILSVEEILGAPDIEERIVEVPEWGGAVKIRTFTQGDYTKIAQQAKVGEDVDNERLQILLFMHGVVEPKFTEAHYEGLRKKSARAMTRVLTPIMEMVGLTKEAQDAAKVAFPEGGA